MKKTVYIVDSDEVFVNELKECISRDYSYLIKGTSSNCHEALDDLKMIGEVDYLIIDPLLKYFDGYVLLNNLKDTNDVFVRNIIVVTPFINDFQYKNFSYFNVDDYILKPCMASSVFFHIKQFDKKTNIDPSFSMRGEKIENRVTIVLQKLGISTSINGFFYLKSAIVKKYNNEKEYMGKTTLKLYPEIAAEFDTTSTRVERSIRHAMFFSW